MKFRQIDQSFEKQVENLLKWNFGEHYKPSTYKFLFSLPSFWKNMYGWVDGQDLVSIWDQFPIEMKIRNKKSKAFFVEDAITEPNYRNQGLIKQAFLANCHKAQTENIDFIVLFPFKHKYYHNFGFASAFNRFQLKTPLNLIAQTSPSRDFYIKIGDLKENKQIKTDFYALLDEYRDKSLYNEHNYFYWGDKHLEYVKDRRVAIVYNSKNHTPQGFLFYGEQNRVLIINGFRYHTLGAFHTLKNFIAAFRDQLDSLHCTSLPEDFPIENFIHSYWNGNDTAIFSYEPSKMLRVVSPKSAFERFMVIPPKDPIRLYLKDPLLPENTGVYTFTKEKKVLFQADPASKDYDLEISIHAIAQLITGRFSTHDLYHFGELVSFGNSEISFLTPDIPKKILELGNLFPKRVTFYPEYN